jgi:predicted RNase H-like HicB family nuclease
MSRYTVVLLPDLENGGYTATVPLLPGCITEGESLEETLAAAREANAAYIQSLNAHGEPVPHEPPPPGLLAEALAEARDTLRWSAATLEAEGKSLPPEVPEPLRMTVDVAEQALQTIPD